MTPTLTAGQAAEKLVESRVRAALPTADGYRVFANVAWTGRTRDRGQLTDGEADLVIAHPDRGFLVVETKSGQISRDAAGRWWAGGHELNPDPFTQAQRSLRALLRSRLTPRLSWRPRPATTRWSFTTASRP